MVDIQRVVQPGSVTAEANARTTAIPVTEGDSIVARVDRLLPNGATRFLSQGGVFELALQTALKPGTLVRITAQPGGPGGEARLTVQVLSNSPGTVAPRQGPPPSPSGQTAPPPTVTVPNGPVSQGAVLAQTTGQVIAPPAPPQTAPSALTSSTLTAVPRTNTGQIPAPASAPAQGQPQSGQVFPLQNAVSASAYQRAATLSTALPSALSGTATAAVPLVNTGTPAATAQQTVIADAVRQAVAGQNSLAPLLGSLGAIAARPQQAAQLPPVLDGVVRHLLGMKLDLNGTPSAGSLKSAQMQSGIFQEAALSRGLPPGDGAPDLKSALLGLRSVLSSMRGDAPSPRLAAASSFAPPPPVRGQQPGAQRMPVAIGLPDITTNDGLNKLLQMTEAALHRLRLSQVSSLNGAELARDLGGNTNAREWNFEMPALFGQATAIMQFQITADGHHAGDPAGRTWTMRFALDFEETGPVSAEVTLRGRTVGIVLRAEREDIAARLSEGEPELRTALEAVGLTLGRLSVHSHEDNAASPHAGAMADQTA